MPYGTSIEQTSAASAKVESWLREQTEASIVTAYVGQGAPRFYLAMSPELPDPSFAKIVVLTPNEAAREALKLRLRQAVADGLAPEARVRVTQLVFGPYSPYPVAFRVMGPDPNMLRDIAGARAHRNAGERTDENRQYRLGRARAHTALFARSGQAPAAGIDLERRGPAAAVPAERHSGHRRARRHSIGAGDRPLGRQRAARSEARSRTSPLVGATGQRVPLSQIGTVDVRMEDPILRRRDRTPTITVRGDIAEGLQPPDVSTAVLKELQPIIATTAGGLSDRGGRLHRRVRQGQSRSGAVVPHHDRAHAHHDHPAGPLDLRDDDGVRNRTAWPHRRHSHPAAVPASRSASTRWLGSIGAVRES